MRLNMVFILAIHDMSLHKELRVRSTFENVNITTFILQFRLWRHLTIQIVAI